MHKAFVLNKNAGYKMNRKLWKKKNRKENFFKVCLAGWGEKKINNGTQVFFFQAYQNIFSSKWREKSVEMNFFLIDKNAHVQMPLFYFIFLLLGQ